MECADKGHVQFAAEPLYGKVQPARWVVMMYDVGIEFPKPFHNLIRVLCPWEDAPYKPGVGLVHRNCLLGPLCLAYHQGLLVNLLKVSVYVQGVRGNAPDAAVDMCDLHVNIRIDLKRGTVNFALHGVGWFCFSSFNVAYHAA